MAKNEDLTCREFIRSYRKKELEGFAAHYRGRQKALPEISPKQLPRSAWMQLFQEYVVDSNAKTG